MATYYVSTSGSNGNTGLDTSHPWQTLQYAEQHATSAGDIIALKRGDIWSTTTALGINHGGSSGNPITWDGDLWGTGDKATIAASGDHPDPDGMGNGGAAMVCVTDTAYVTFQNVIFDGNNNYCYGFVVGGDPSMTSTGVDQSLEDNIILQDCDFRDIGGSSDYCIAILCKTWFDGMSNLTIQRNTIDGVGSWGIAIYNSKEEDWTGPGPYPGNMETTNVYVGYNTVTNCEKANFDLGVCIGCSLWITGIVMEYNTITQGASGHPVAGIGISGWNGVYPTGVHVRYNSIQMTDCQAIVIENGGPIEATIYYNKCYSGTTSSGGGTFWAFYPTMSMTGADIKIYNNTFVANNCHGFVNDVPSGYGTIFTVKNNIFICTATSGYTALYTGSPITHSNNCFWRTATGSPVFVNNNGSYYYESTITSYEATAIGEDPLLVNRAGFNYHLSSGSPCRDEGANLGLTQDFDGYVEAPRTFNRLHPHLIRSTHI